jgi:ferredoxin
MQEGLKGWPVDAARIHTELFGPSASMQPGVVVGQQKTSPNVPPGVQGTGPTVSFLRSGVTLRWNNRFRSLLELAEACSVPVRWSCRSGVCHNCESGLVDGRVRYSPAPLDPPPDGVVLICCSTPDSEVTLDL